MMQRENVILMTPAEVSPKEMWIMEVDIICAIMERFLSIQIQEEFSHSKFTKKVKDTIFCILLIQC